MALEPRPKELYYKQAVFLDEQTAKTLQQMVDEAKAKLSDADQRGQKIGHEGEIMRLWNKSGKSGELTCGMFHSYEKGRIQLLLALKANVKEYEVVAQGAPKGKDGVSHEYNEGLLFFGIHKNHVIVLQSASLRMSALEDYLNWLLATAGVNPAENRFQFRDPLPQKLGTRKIAPLKNIILMPKLSGDVESGEASVAKPKEQRMSLNPAQWGPFKTLLATMGAAVPDRLSLSEDFKAERVKVEIRFVWTGRDKDRVETPVLDTILHAFQDMDDPPIRAETVDGEKINGKKLRHSAPFQILHDGKVPMATDVWKRMLEYLTRLLKNAEIPV